MDKIITITHGLPKYRECKGKNHLNTSRSDAGAPQINENIKGTRLRNSTINNLKTNIMKNEQKTDVVPVITDLNGFEPDYNKVFIYNGRKLKCVDYDSRKCWSCFFNKEDKHNCKIKCQASERRDKKSVMIVNA